MELERVIEILEKHQQWRRDQNVPPKVKMQSPIEIGAAIDYAISELKKLRLSIVSNSLPYPIEILDGLKVEVEFSRGRLVIKKQ